MLFVIKLHAMNNFNRFYYLLIAAYVQAHLSSKGRIEKPLFVSEILGK
jgi:hypothetical protein